MLYPPGSGTSNTPLEMAEKTLQQMARGGMYDHIGGGFHRYSVDEHWHVPHFEKVLSQPPASASVSTALTISLLVSALAQYIYKGCSSLPAQTSHSPQTAQNTFMRGECRQICRMLGEVLSCEITCRCCTTMASWQRPI